MDSFVAIDVETANRERTSICSIGAVKVTDGIITDSRYSLVCPEPEWYSRYNTAVHGLTEEDTWDAPNFASVWKELQPWIGDLPLVAHNAPFDYGCIRAACRMYGLDEPEPFQCTLAAARKAIPRGMCPSKSLDMLCEFFGIPLENHHDALSDATACAKLGIILL